MIARDATLADVLRTLADPGAYLPGVLRRMEECLGVHGTASVRIGVTGAGKCPNYRVEYSPPGEGESAPPRLHGAYRCPGHRPFADDEFFLEGASWSTRAAGLDEVRSLVALLRGAAAG